eukprot:474740-Hanusia_phi.AAC.3
MSPNGRVVAISAPDGSSNTEEMIKSAEDAERQAKERTAAALERKRIAEEMLETALAEAQVAERKLEEALARKAALLGVSVTSLSGDKGDVDHNADTESDSEKNNAGSKRSRSAFQVRPALGPELVRLMCAGIGGRRAGGACAEVERSLMKRDKCEPWFLSVTSTTPAMAGEVPTCRSAASMGSPWRRRAARNPCEQLRETRRAGCSCRR